jgi:hypothetical protein
VCSRDTGTPILPSSLVLFLYNAPLTERRIGTPAKLQDVLGGVRLLSEVRPKATSRVALSLQPNVTPHIISALCLHGERG